MSMSAAYNALNMGNKGVSYNFKLDYRLADMLADAANKAGTAKTAMIRSIILSYFGLPHGCRPLTAEEQGELRSRHPEKGESDNA